MKVSGIPAVSKMRVYLAFVGLCLVLSSIPGGPQIPQLLWNLWSIARDPAETSGTVMRLDCRNHGHVEYVVEIGASTIEGRQQNVAGADCRLLKVGQRIAVSYQRGMPENNYAFSSRADGNPAEKEFYLGLIMWTSFVVIGPLFVVVLWSIFSKVTTALNN
jgi:hypothetical protein